MTESTPADRLLVPGHVVARVLPDVTILLNTATGEYFTLDEIGARTWTLVTSSTSRQAVYEALLAEYEVTPDELGRDLDALLTRLVDAGLLERARA